MADKKRFQPRNRETHPITRGFNIFAFGAGRSVRLQLEAGVVKTRLVNVSFEAGGQLDFNLISKPVSSDPTGQTCHSRPDVQFDFNHLEAGVLRTRLVNVSRSDQDWSRTSGHHFVKISFVIKFHSFRGFQCNYFFNFKSGDLNFWYLVKGYWLKFWAFTVWLNTTVKLHVWQDTTCLPNNR